MLRAAGAKEPEETEARRGSDQGQDDRDDSMISLSQTTPAHNATAAGGDGGSNGKLSEGAKVKAKVKGWTKFYPGTIKRDNGDGTFDIEFEDGEIMRYVERSRIEGGEADGGVA